MKTIATITQTDRPNVVLNLHRATVSRGVASVPLSSREALDLARALALQADYRERPAATVSQGTEEALPVLSRKESLALIETAYGALYSLDNQSMSTRHREALFREVQAEEKGHRVFKPDGLSCGLTIAQACRLFVVLRIAEAMAGWHPFGRELIDCQRSAVTACGVYHRFAELIHAAWEKAGVDPAKVRALDYAFLNDERKPAHPERRNATAKA